MYAAATDRRSPHHERPPLASRRRAADQLPEPATVLSGPPADAVTPVTESLSYEAWIRGDGLRPD